jgi:hypothetical protein
LALAEPVDQPLFRPERASPTTGPAHQPGASRRKVQPRRRAVLLPERQAQAQ